MRRTHWESDRPDASRDAVVLKLTCSTLRSEDQDTLIDKWSHKRRVRVVLDLGNVQYLSSAAIGKLINLKKRVAGLGGKLRLENLRPELLEVFRITRVDQEFDIGK